MSTATSSPVLAKPAVKMRETANWVIFAKTDNVSLVNVHCVQRRLNPTPSIANLEMCARFPAAAAPMKPKTPSAPIVHSPAPAEMV